MSVNQSETLLENTSNSANNTALNAPVKKAFFAYLFPSICATLTTSIYVLFDTIMIGWYEGDMGILALNIVLPMYSLTMAIGVLFGIGGGVRYSVAIGKGETENARKIFTAAFSGVILCVVTVLVLSNVFFMPLMRMLGANENSMRLVAGYGRYVTLGVPVFSIAMFLQAFIRNDRNPRLAMIAVICGGVTNVVLDYVFVFPLNMGMNGAALATVISYALNCLILCTHFLRKKSGLKFCFKFKPKLIVACAGGGISSFIAELSGGLVIFAFNLSLLKYIGETGVVVYGVISNVSVIALSLFNGVAQACQPIVSASYGASKHDRIRAVVRLGLIAAAIMGVLVCLMGEISPVFLVKMFNKAPSQAVLNLAPMATRIYFCAMPLMTFSIFYIVYFQSVVRAKSAFVISLLRGAVLPVLGVLLLPLFFGGNSVWFVMPIAEAIAVGVAVYLNVTERNRLKRMANISKNIL